MSGLLIRWTCAAQATWHDSDDSKSCQHVLIWKSCLDLFHICSLCWSGFCCCQDFIILAILLILPWNEWNYLEVLHCFRCQIFSSGLPLHVFQRQHAKAFSNVDWLGVETSHRFCACKAWAQWSRENLRKELQHTMAPFTFTFQSNVKAQKYCLVKKNRCLDVWQFCFQLNVAYKKMKKITWITCILCLDFIVCRSFEVIGVSEFHVAKDLDTSAGAWATCIPMRSLRNGR